MKALLVVATILLASCAPAQKSSPNDEAARTALAKRIDQICALPNEAERQAALDKLKQDTGLVLLCGGVKKP